MIKFFIDGKPQGKDRPRFGNGKVYTTSKTRSYEEKIQLAYKSMAKDFSFNTEPLRAEITAFFYPPTSVSKKNKELMIRGEVKYTKKPDIDNIAKVVLDSLNGIAYKDDSQVVSIAIKKEYSDFEGIEVIFDYA